MLGGNNCLLVTLKVFWKECEYFDVPFEWVNASPAASEDIEFSNGRHLYCRRVRIQTELQPYLSLIPRWGRRGSANIIGDPPNEPNKLPLYSCPPGISRSLSCDKQHQLRLYCFSLQVIYRIRPKADQLLLKKEVSDCPYIDPSTSEQSVYVALARRPNRTDPCNSKNGCRWIHNPFEGLEKSVNVYPEPFREVSVRAGLWNVNHLRVYV